METYPRNDNTSIRIDGENKKDQKLRHALAIDNTTAYEHMHTSHRIHFNETERPNNRKKHNTQEQRIVKC